MKKNHTLPPVPEAFHQRVQHTLEGLPEQTRSQRRFPLRGVVTDENDHYRMTVDAFLFDEATGTGLVRLHIENKAGDGVRPFEVLEYYPQYQNQPGLAWSRSGAMEMGSWPSR